MGIDVEQVMKDFRFSKTVYSWVMPETERVVEELQSEIPHQHELRDWMREAWTKKQDVYDKLFLSEWIEWASDLVSMDTEKDFPYGYPTAGSSEAIRETLAQHASIGKYKPVNGLPTIHVFEGEYEGYEALAEPYGIQVVKHDRSNWKESLFQYTGKEGREHLFYLSQPSSINGCVWSGFSEFMDWVEANTQIEVALDLCYVGTVPSSKWTDLIDTGRWKNIKHVFFSLSKVFGVYYRRIGGVFSRDPIPGLYGNKWFKNISSMRLGRQLMSRFGPFELPDKYKAVQWDVIQELKDDLNEAFCEDCGPLFDLRSSDVFLLAREYRHFGIGTPSLSHSPDIRKHMARTQRTARYCLTQRLYEAVQAQGEYDE